MKITFIGLGIMGSRMARQLLEKGHQLTVYNRSPEPARELEQAGARRASGLRDAVSKTDVVISMLSDPAAVRDVFFGPEGALELMQEDTIWMDCSTVNPSFTRECSDRAFDADVKFIDAPVAGSLPQAEKAELVFFVGGDEDTIETVRPLLEAMGRQVLHVGTCGQGTSLKMIVNAMLAQSMVMFSEALLLGESMGLDRDFLLDTLPGLPVAAPFTQFKAAMIRRNDYPQEFPLELMYKDLHLAAQTAYENQRPLYLTNVVKELYAGAMKRGLARRDFAAIHQFLDSEG